MSPSSWRRVGNLLGWTGQRHRHVKTMTDLQIAICTFNRAAALDLCLTALSRQEAAPGSWQVMVIDNRSTDATPEVVARHIAIGHLPGLRRIREERPGVVAARQRAVAESAAPWVGFVDDDCHLDPDWIAAARAAIWRYPGAGAFGGRVVPDWAPGVPRDRRKHGWLFAEQDHGPRVREVGSLVGTGLVVNRAALMATGWLDDPLIEDRIGRGVTSGGDVEMSFRLRSSGRALCYVPGMRLVHMVDPGRQTLRGMIRLSAGLGAGSALVTLLAAPGATAGDAAAATRYAANAAEVAAAGLRCGLGDLRLVLARKYGFGDWLIYRAFARGRLRQLRALTAAPDLLRRIAGRSPQPPLPDA